MSPGAFGLEHRSFAATRLEDIAKVTADRRRHAKTMYASPETERQWLQAKG
ncbi:MAG: hypothetical protein ACJ8MH_15125 [Povalibacter sp.]